MSIRDMCSGDPATVPGEIRGYRMWRRQGSFLTATNAFNGEWIRPELTAECRRGDTTRSDPLHRAPVDACGCGIYGWYRPDDTRLHHGNTFGVIAASGRVLLGDYGFRAERARILGLVIYPRPSAGEDLEEDGRETAAGAYWRERGVAVFDTPADLVDAFPPDDVAELLGRPLPPSGVPDLSPRTWFDAFLQASAARAAFTRDLDQLVQVVRSAGTGFAHLARDVQTSEVMAAALAARRRGHRGPQRRHRGRARLGGTA